MTPIKFNAILNSVRTRRDNSLGLSIETPEMTNEETLIMLRLRGINLDCILTPLASEEMPAEVKGEIDTKTPAQRIRGALFAFYKHEIETQKISKDIFFELYYAQKCEKILDWIKTKLPQP